MLVMMIGAVVIPSLLFLGGSVVIDYKVFLSQVIDLACFMVNSLRSFVASDCLMS